MQKEDQNENKKTETKRRNQDQENKSKPGTRMAERIKWPERYVKIRDPETSENYLLNLTRVKTQQKQQKYIQSNRKPKNHTWNNTNGNSRTNKNILPIWRKGNKELRYRK